MNKFIKQQDKPMHMISLQQMMYPILKALDLIDRLDRRVVRFLVDKNKELQLQELS